MRGVSEAIARQTMRIAAYKMPVKTKFLIREGFTPCSINSDFSTIQFCSFLNIVQLLYLYFYDSTTNVSSGC